MDTTAMIVIVLKVSAVVLNIVSKTIIKPKTKITMHHNPNPGVIVMTTHHPGDGDDDAGFNPAA